MKPEKLSTKEAAAYCDFDVRTWRNMISNGQAPKPHLADKWYYRHLLDKWLASLANKFTANEDGLDQDLDQDEEFNMTITRMKGVV